MDDIAFPIAGFTTFGAATPGIESYNVLGSVLSDVAPTQTFLDGTLLPGQAAKMFYKIELAP